MAPRSSLESIRPQIAAFGVYELADYRYQVLCGIQGAGGVAYPDLLEAFLDTPAAYSTTGRQAFRRQQRQAIRSTVVTVGRNQGRSQPTPVPVKGQGQGRGKETNRGD